MYEEGKPFPSLDSSKKFLMKVCKQASRKVLSSESSYIFHLMHNHTDPPKTFQPPPGQSTGEVVSPNGL
jgi:hypothetical protein